MKKIMNITKLEEQQILLNQIVEKDFGRVAVILEGRDTAGKTGTIRELTHYLPTSKYSISLSSKPSAWDMKHWLKSWKRKLPSDNQIVFFDRSWYSRAMVQQLNGWCTDKQYNKFMNEVCKWENKQDITFIKLWLSISEEEQAMRIGERQSSPLTKWKFSPNDAVALSKYDQMTILKERVFTTLGEWHSIDYNNKKAGRLALITKIVEILQGQ
jgi:polyphosphate kinase 2 (PPK2 family)